MIGLTVDQRLLRAADLFARGHLRKQVKDPELRTALTPDYTIGCKRILKSNDWYPALQKDNVEVLHSGVTEVRGNKVVDADGEEREVDAIIFGTGFHVEDMPVASYVRTRRGQTLEDKWEGSPQAYLGIAISDCPNFFMLTGPNSGQGHTSMVFMIESQIEQVKLALDARDANGGGTIEVHPGAEKAWNAKLQKRTETTVWTQGGCSSWYLDRNGKNSILWPDWTWRFRMRCKRFVANHWIARPGKRAPAEPEPAKAAA
ncbi:MAG: NAD(P)/FAD-dependent oxidoreductase [Thermoleophilaceae bacterium]|nr:NAD(P)/FAD-dependent oxidoreductase [Thermoleophilaceae bacterium]